MPSIGPLELAVILVVALLVLGPKRLPEVGRSVGQGIREFKGSLSLDDEDEIPAANGLPRTPVGLAEEPLDRASGTAKSRRGTDDKREGQGEH